MTAQRLEGITHEYESGVQVFIILLGKLSVILVGLFFVHGEEVCFVLVGRELWEEFSQGFDESGFKF